MRQPVIVTFSPKPSRLLPACDSLRSLGFRVIAATTPAGVRAACRVLKPLAVIVEKSACDVSGRQAADVAHEHGAKVVVVHEGSFDHRLPADYCVRMQPGSYHLFYTLLELCG